MLITTLMVVQKCWFFVFIAFGVNKIMCVQSWQFNSLKWLFIEHNWPLLILEKLLVTFYYFYKRLVSLCSVGIICLCGLQARKTVKLPLLSRSMLFGVFTLFRLLKRRTSRARERVREVLPQLIDFHLQSLGLWGAAPGAADPRVVRVQEWCAFPDGVHVIWKRTASFYAFNYKTVTQWVSVKYNFVKTSREQSLGCYLLNKMPLKYLA